MNNTLLLLGFDEAKDVLMDFPSRHADKYEGGGGMARGEDCQGRLGRA